MLDGNGAQGQFTRDCGRYGRTEYENAQRGSVPDVRLFVCAIYEPFDFQKRRSDGHVKVEKGMMPQIELKAKHSYSVLLKKGSSVKDIRYELKLNDR